MHKILLEAVLKKIIKNCKNMNEILLETVVVKLVVGPQRRQSSHSDAVGEEDLSGAVDPGRSFFKLRPIDNSTFTDIVLQTHLFLN